jgi:hypothetical protein
MSTLVEEFDNLMSCVKLEVEVNVISWNLLLNQFKEKLRQIDYTNSLMDNP